MLESRLGDLDNRIARPTYGADGIYRLVSKHDTRGKSYPYAHLPTPS
jgi:hypothetical protein